MSWFSEIAGKAEDLLNRVDQSAATALHNKSKTLSTESSRSTVRGFDTTHSGSNSYHSASENSASLKIKNSVSEGKTRHSHKRTSGALSPMRKPESDDEKLLQFLNSKEDLPSSRISRSSPISPAKKDMIQENLPHENVVDAPNTKSDGGRDLSAGALKVPVLNNLPAGAQQFNADVTTLDEEEAPVKQQVEHQKIGTEIKQWNPNLSESERAIVELREREKDLTAAVDAKDSQLAILRVRLQEADHHINSNAAIIENLKTENDKLIRDHAEASHLQNRSVQELREQLASVEAELAKSRETQHLAQCEQMQQMSRFEEERHHLSDSYTILQRKWTETNDKNKELMLQLRNANDHLGTLQQEYNEYKQKAQRILQSKEKLIASLKDGSWDADQQAEREDASSMLLVAELESMRQERDLLKSEVHRASEAAEAHRLEVQQVEQMAQREASALSHRLQAVKQVLEGEKVCKEELQLLNVQLKEELQFLREDSSKTKISFTNQIQDRDIDIEKLRRQLTAKCVSSAGERELESRVRALTESLIQKQTIVEALGTEKNALALQLERMELQLKESQRFGSQQHTFVGVNNVGPDRKNRSLLMENSFDSSFSQRVKRVYGGIDALSIRLGMFFRRYPFTRIFVIVYMLLLHLWVMVVLLTYEPEVHNSSYGVIEKK